MQRRAKRASPARRRMNIPVLNPGLSKDARHQRCVRNGGLRRVQPDAAHLSWGGRVVRHRRSQEDQHPGLSVGESLARCLSVAMSVLASCMSAITLLGTPAEVYRFGTQYIMILVAFCLVIPATAYLYLPVFYNLGLTSAYETCSRETVMFGSQESWVDGIWISKLLIKKRCFDSVFLLPRAAVSQLCENNRDHRLHFTHGSLSSGRTPMSVTCNSSCTYVGASILLFKMDSSILGCRAVLVPVLPSELTMNCELRSEKVTMQPLKQFAFRPLPVRNTFLIRPQRCSAVPIRSAST
ncbi:hypothetical protein CEXT_411731 [Caerostris extrusa]|uniref:Uncharacterized protein n=1 Tax=Caerostris extrusa TaxID=172846 RepID=A0AAV4T8Y0_CAEEX|nr:hypothetical protein CEXT_411731 [Caerostris extrusa]